MRTLEDQVRAAFEELADEAQPAPLLQRLEKGSENSRTGPSARRAVVAAAASVVALAVTAAALILLRTDDPPVVPAVDPPKVFRLTDDAVRDPGPGAMLVVLSDVTTARRFLHEKPAYLLPADGAAGAPLEESDTVATWTEHLSQDGTRVIRQTDAIHGSSESIVPPGLEILDLRSGSIDNVHGAAGVCPALSPDNSAVAAYWEGDTRIIDVASGRSTTVDRDAQAQVCGGLAWSPDSVRLLVPDARESRIVDREGRTISRFPGRRAVNASMSWSPDGRALLLYDEANGRFVSRQVADGSEVVLAVPAGAIRPLGWAGERIVWLAGDIGEQRLVTTDDRGGEPRLWTRLKIRGMAVEVVSWSTALRGAAED